MNDSNRDKHKQYARYAAYCFEMAAATRNSKTRLTQHDMAAEWLELADAALHPLKRWDLIRPQQSQAPSKQPSAN